MLGDGVVLVPIPRGKKKPSVPWGDLQPTAMRNLAHIKSLNKGNIGVIQGKKSGGICSIDIDHDDEVAPFLDLNPALAKSLRTKGQRGENIWLQMSGHYPGLSIIQTRTEAPWGEWRADGAQTVIYGIHPSGQPYSFVYEAKPACVAFGQIVWPAHVIPPVLTLVPECTQGTQEDSGGLRRTQEDSVELKALTLPSLRMRLCVEGCSRPWNKSSRPASRLRKGRIIASCSN